MVDDDAALPDVVEELLSGKGHDVVTVGDAAAAIRAITEAEPDVMLLDIDMPGLTGVDALPAIRAVAPSVAVIMLSGNTDTDVARSALARGAFDDVVKPIDFAYLDRSLEAALALKALS